jgi:hypothetical protein
MNKLLHVGACQTERRERGEEEGEVNPRTSGGGDAEQEVVSVQLACRDLVEEPLTREQRATMKYSHRGLLTELQGRSGQENEEGELTRRQDVPLSSTSGRASRALNIALVKGFSLQHWQGVR